MATPDGYGCCCKRRRRSFYFTTVAAKCRAPVFGVASRDRSRVLMRSPCAKLSCAFYSNADLPGARLTASRRRPRFRSGQGLFCWLLFLLDYPRDAMGTECDQQPAMALPKLISVRLGEPPSTFLAPSHLISFPLSARANSGFLLPVLSTRRYPMASVRLENLGAVNRP